MAKIKHILADTKHRVFNFPTNNWSYYQEWNNALFLHWKIPSEMLKAVIPANLNLDTFEGDAYISLVAFTMQKIRPRNLPAVNFISDFEEINLRTYVDNENKKGVYFLNIEAAKQLSVFVAKKLSGLPYEKSNIKRSDKRYTSNNTLKNFHLDAKFEIGEILTSKDELDKWLTERYCLYLDKNNKIYRYEIHHKEWEIKNVNLKQLKLSYKIGEIDLTDIPPHITHYSDGVQVLAWNRIECTY